MDVGRSGGAFHLGLRRSGPAVGDVVGDGVVEQHGVLRHDADRLAQAVLRELAQVLAVDGDRAAGDVVEAVQQPRQRALARAAGADDGHRLAGGDLEADVVQDRPRRVVREAHVLEAHRAAVHVQHAGVGRVGDLAILLEQREHALEVGQPLLDLAVQHAEEVQRHVQLDQQRVDHHEVAQRHRMRDHAARRAPQQRDQAAGDDQLLAGVEHRQRRLRLHLRGAERLEAGLVARRLELLVVEVLDRLEVDQRVDRLGVGLGVELVDRLAVLGAPLGDRDRERAVQQQRGQRDPHVAEVELVAQQHQHEAELDQRRDDRVQRVRHQRLQRLRAALDVARQAAGLAFEVEAQRQRVEMLEGLERHALGRAEGGAREHDLAQLGEQRHREPQAGVAEQQPERHHQQRARIGGGDVEGVDQPLEQQRHAHAGHLGRDEERQRDRHAHAVFPEVGHQPLQGLPVAARLGGRRGVAGGGGRVRVHETAQVGTADTITRRRRAAASRRSPWSPSPARIPVRTAFLVARHAGTAV